MSNIRKIKFSTFTARTSTQFKNIVEKTEYKIKGTFLEKWVKYWKLLCKDYKDVALSLQEEAREKPIKAALTVTGLSSLAFIATQNPNQQSFRAKYVQCANDLSVVSVSVANPESMRHVKYIEQCYNANLIRYNSFGLFSLIWVDNYSKECDTYESNCSHLKVQYRKFADSVLDVGFMNIWWVISRRMLDYDINY
ncbi:unnamed protein product [Brassicogethes aeneus]|uniref:Mitochondrial import inner membrane translocase subunit Tim29 n=1 Tax=Brassicogethes aeneus TaxID=1431903 RepID=A0A9P0FM18_BRAAE|nr:unnamed protein product [Brassicogethes aeneus]